MNLFSWRSQVQIFWGFTVNFLAVGLLTSNYNSSFWDLRLIWVTFKNNSEKNDLMYVCFVNVKKRKETSGISLFCSTIMVEIWVYNIMRTLKFEFYINHSYIDKNQISENKNELNWFKISSFGCNIVARWLIQHWEEKHGSRSKHTEKQFEGKRSQKLIRFLRLRLQFSFLFLKKNSIFTCLTLNMPRQIKKINTTK